MAFKLLIAEETRDVADVVAFGARMTWPGCVVVIAADGAQALRSFEDEAPDLIILDVGMPPPDGLSVCRRIRESSQVPILMLSAQDGTLDKVRAFDLGADDYLTKPFDHLELLARLRALVRRSSGGLVALRSEIAAGELHLDYVTHAVRLRGEMLRLTSTEYRLLEQLVRNAGTVLSHQSLLDRVWGTEYGASAQYLKVFVRRLRQKLGDDAEFPRYIQTEWGVGYRFVPA